MIEYYFYVGVLACILRSKPVTPRSRRDRSCCGWNSLLEGGFEVKVKHLVALVVGHSESTLAAESERDRALGGEGDGGGVGDLGASSDGAVGHLDVDGLLDHGHGDGAVLTAGGADGSERDDVVEFGVEGELGAFLDVFLKLEVVGEGDGVAEVEGAVVAAVVVGAGAVLVERELAGGAGDRVEGTVDSDDTVELGLLDGSNVDVLGANVVHLVGGTSGGADESCEDAELHFGKNERKVGKKVMNEKKKLMCAKASTR